MEVVSAPNVEKPYTAELKQILSILQTMNLREDRIEVIVWAIKAGINVSNKSQHIAQIGAKIHNYIATVKGIKEITSNLGKINGPLHTLYAVSLWDVDGNLLSYLTKSKDFRDGMVVSLNAEIREHSTYKGVNATKITAVKWSVVSEPPEVEKPEEPVRRGFAEGI